MVYSLKDRDTSLLLSFLFSVCMYLVRQNKEVNVKVLRHCVMYLWAVLAALQMKCHFGFCALMEKARGCPYDKQFRFTLCFWTNVSFHPAGRGNSTWQSVETKKSPHCFHKHVMNTLLPQFVFIPPPNTSSFPQCPLYPFSAFFQAPFHFLLFFCPLSSLALHFSPTLTAFEVRSSQISTP